MEFYKFLTVHDIDTADRQRVELRVPAGMCGKDTIFASSMRRVAKRMVLLALLLGWMTAGRTQTFGLEKQTDSLYFLTLSTDSMLHRWLLPHPVYRFCTGDVDGDERVDALVGVVNQTRFYRQRGRRLFIFKNYKGRVRPLWLGSKLGGILQDFRFVAGRVRSLETTRDGLYVVAEYRWQGFGLGFVRFLVVKVGREEALRVFESEDE